MGRGVKLGLGGLGFFLTNGTTFLALKNSFHSSDSLENLNWGGASQDRKEKTLKLDFSKKKENDLPIVSAKQDTLPEVKLELENKESKLDIPSGLFDYSSNNVFTKVKDIFLEIEKENRVNEQKQQIQNFEELARSVKDTIPKVFEKLIDRISKSFLSKNEREGGKSSSTDSSETQASVEATSPDAERENGRDIQEQQLKGTGEVGKNEESETEVEEMGNCVIDPSTIKEILQVRDLESEYYFVSCTNTDSDENYYVETFDGKRWGGAFPRILFRSKGLSERTSLNIKARASEEDPSDEEATFVFEFESDKFSSEYSKIIGDFQYESEKRTISSNGRGVIVKLTTPEHEKEIYLLTNLDNSDSD